MMDMWKNEVADSSACRDRWRISLDRQNDTWYVILASCRVGKQKMDSIGGVFVGRY